MPIIYALVARRTTVLAEFTSATGNFTTITRRILEKIPAQNERMSYTYDQHLFHYIVEDSLTYLCMSDEAFSRRIVFSFLEDVRNRFKATYGDRSKTALAYGMNDDFSKVLRSRMDFYSNDPSADKVNQVREEIGEVKNIMVKNIEKVLDRGEKIELLVDKSENLNKQSKTFKQQSTKLKTSMWWKNMKLNLLIAFIVGIILFFIIMAICGVQFKCGQ
eukprot:c10339_g1_i1.p1 GENE.c10339_g1_i1~~c10339_g1_i1.p1  ORF type:complete len:225 (-),score=53.32 c10339_g1_i1:113-766(-)